VPGPGPPPGSGRRSRSARPTGVTVLLGLLVSLEAHPQALVRAAVGAGLAEWVGMSAGQYLSDQQAGIRVALANGTAALIACVAPAVPYLAGGGPVPLAASLALVCSVAAVVSLLRPEHGWRAFAATFGILAAAAALCWAATLA
jgi:hypothetical protein